MKVTITDREVKEVERVYPYVGKADNLTVWFISKDTGIVLKDITPTLTIRWEVGRYSEAWVEENFTPLVNKTITIEV